MAHTHIARVVFENGDGQASSGIRLVSESPTRVAQGAYQDWIRDPSGPSQEPLFIAAFGREELRPAQGVGREAQIVRPATPGESKGACLFTAMAELSLLAVAFTAQSGLSGGSVPMGPLFAYLKGGETGVFYRPHGAHGRDE